MLNKYATALETLFWFMNQATEQDLQDLTKEEL